MRFSSNYSFYSRRHCERPKGAKQSRGLRARLWIASSLGLLAMTVMAPSAQAEVYFWQDPATKLSVTVPDTWRMVHDQKPDDVLTFLAPGENDHAGCTLRVREDRRFVIYPVRYSGSIQRLNYSRDFWEKYITEYDNGVLNAVTDNASLGRGFASYADASYVTTIGPKMNKRALIFASVYNDRAYILECSAEAASYDKWYNSFLSIAKAVNFRKIIYEFPAGNYRDFLQDPAVRIEGDRNIDVSYY